MGFPRGCWRGALTGNLHSFWWMSGGCSPSRSLISRLRKSLPPSSKSQSPSRSPSYAEFECGCSFTSRKAFFVCCFCCLIKVTLKCYPSILCTLLSCKFWAHCKCLIMLAWQSRQTIHSSLLTLKKPKTKFTFEMKIF